MRVLLSITAMACASTAIAQQDTGTSAVRPGTVAPPVTNQTPPDTGLTPGRIDGGATQGPANSALLYDNGPVDGVNGYSDATVNAFGARRTLLFDFNVPTGETWNLDCMEWHHIWASGAPAGTGSSAESQFYGVFGGGGPDPGQNFGVANILTYTPVATGNTFFSRPEVLSTTTFDPISLAEGDYWIDHTVVGPENNFWLTSTEGTGSQGANAECWVDYQDFNGLEPGINIFGVTSELAGRLYGNTGGGGGAKCLVWDNDATNGVNGYSNAVVTAFGARRTLLDDITIEGKSWAMNSFCWTHVWGDGAPAGTGTDADLQYMLSTGGGAPDQGTAVAANVTSYSETDTGNIFFSRPEVASVAGYDAIGIAGTGQFWCEATVVGPQNNFWLVHDNLGNGQACWVDYEDFNGLEPGINIFGVDAELNFQVGAENTIGTNFCDALANSTGNTGTICAVGSETAADNNVTLHAGNLPPGQFGFALNGPQQANIPVGSGILCVAPPGRHNLDITLSTQNGNSFTCLDLTGLPRPTGGPHTVLPGETWYFTFWHRDVGSTSNFTDGICITFN